MRPGGAPTGFWLAVLLVFLVWLAGQRWPSVIKILLFVAVLWLPAALAGGRVVSELISLFR
jgi:hypothetical protein